jgi:hypothetical protein
MEQLILTNQFSLWARFKRCLAVMQPARVASYYLSSVSISVSHFHDNVELFSLRKHYPIKLPLAAAVRRPELLQQMSGLDVSILQTLAREEDLRYGTTHNDFPNAISLSAFCCIEDDFFSTRHQKHMLVIEIPGSDHQQCLSLREFVNDESLLRAVRNFN